MRTEFTGSAGYGPEGSDRPIWEGRDSSELAGVIGAGQAAHSSDSADLDERAAGYPPPTPRSGRHQAAHKAPRRRDAARNVAAAESAYDEEVVERQRDGQGEAGTDRRPRTRGDLVRTGIRGLGQTLITFGMIVLLFVVYELFITDLLNDQAQQNLTQELEQKWADEPTVGPDLPSGGLSEMPLGDG
ncbi:MAG: hypothetical protein M3400_17540, partial [Actinomycetota bacterium]|nr:hypothetical protein [Actinomycetota bacterium]